MGTDLVIPQPTGQLAAIIARNIELETRLARLEQRLAGQSWTGKEARPDNWDERRTVDVRNHQQAVIALDKVIDPPKSTPALRHAKRQATTALLTHLPNRRAMMNYLEAFGNFLVHKTDKPSTLSIASIDIVGFKHFNDDYDYERTGNRVLQLIGQSVDQTLEELGLTKPKNGSFRLFHTGGDEFFIVGRRRLNDGVMEQFGERLTEVFTELIETELNDPESNMVVEYSNKAPRPEHVAPSFDDDCVAIRYGYTARTYNGGDHAFTNQIVAAAMRQMVSSNLELTRTKVDISDRRHDGADGPNDRRAHYDTSGHGEIVMWGDEQRLVRVRTAKSMEEVLPEAAKPVYSTVTSMSDARTQLDDGGLGRSIGR